MTLKSTLILLALIGMSSGEAALAAPAPQEGYSTEILRSPVFDLAHVTLDAAAFNNWLNDNYRKLTVNQMAGPREHLYYLIDSYIKHRFEETGRILPTEHDLMLQILFSWAEPLGVYGGNQIFNSVKSEDTPAREATMPVPAGMSLALEYDLMRVQSDLGWQVSFPYYFMIGQLQDFERTDGLRTQLMVVSTGAAKDSGGDSHSQATLMVMFSPDSNMNQFREFWEQQFEITSQSERAGLGVAGLTSQRNQVTELRLHREIVFWESDVGAIAVAYLGNDGTYQWNRAHFLDFVRELEKGANALPN